MSTPQEMQSVDGGQAMSVPTPEQLCMIEINSALAKHGCGLIFNEIHENGVRAHMQYTVRRVPTPPNHHVPTPPNHQQAS